MGIDAFAAALYWGSRIITEDSLRIGMAKTSAISAALIARTGTDGLRLLTQSGLYREAFVLDDENIVIFSTDPSAALGSPRHILQTDYTEINRARTGEAAAGFPYLFDGEHHLRGYVSFGPDGQVLGLQAASPTFDSLDRLERIFWAWIVLSILLCGLIVYFYAYTVREFELERARADRGERFEMVGRMAATVAHEIRNPLNIMSATIELRKREIERDGSEEEIAILEDLGEEIYRLENVVQDFLDLTRERDLEIAPVALNAAVELVVAGEEKRAQAGGKVAPTFTLQLDREVGNVPLDEGRIIQMLSNLVRNASEACRDGEVIIATKRESSGAVVTIEDSGPGIAAEEREKIFEPFLTMKREGNGLGLAVVKNIVTRHGGTIEVGDGSLGGARFRIRLPGNYRKVTA